MAPANETIRTQEDAPTIHAFSLIEALHQGVGFGVFIGMAIALVARTEFAATVVLSVLLGTLVWPMIVGLIHASDGKSSAGASVACLLARLAGGLVLLAFAASMLLILALKIHVDFLH